MTSLRGHRAQVAVFLEAARGGKLHHAWLLAGPQGIGKARFAQSAALRLLAESAGPAPTGEGLSVPPDHPVAHLIAAESHADYRYLERLPKDPREQKLLRRERSGGEELLRNINIAQIRALQGLFNATPALSPRRVVVIDSIDDLERGAANALLKNLEEPPADTLFLLVSHAPGRLLPTIRSRCRLLRFHPLDDAAMADVLGDEAPGLDREEIEALIAAGQGSPGRALGFAGLGIAAMDQALVEIAETGDPANAARVALARSLAGKAAQKRYEAFLQRVPGFIAVHAQQRSGAALAEALTIWEEARSLAAGAIGLSLDPQGVVFELATLIAGLAPKRAFS